jgi:predicted alpha-1,2-mannosidase
MKRNKLNLLCFVIAGWGFTLFSQSAQSQTSVSSDLASYVNPFVGTANQGNTYPGAVAPFGSVQMTPNWAGNGYYYRDRHMHGFVVNHMSGDGGDNEGQVLMTATTGPVKIDRTETDYSFDHQHESASAGYYQVLMQPWNINAELTATVHCGFVKFVFPAGKQANILLPLSYVNNAIISSHVHYVDSQTVEGDVNAESFNGYHLGITVYFVMKFSKPFATHGTWTDKTIHDGSDLAAQDDRKTIIGFYGSYPAFDNSQEVDVRIGVSYTDLAGARANLQAEMPDNDFERYHQQTVQAWNKSLSVIETKGGTTEHNRIFYTALYHCLIAPQIFDDVDGRYRGFDDKIHHVPEGHKHFYTTFSGWDIYRTQSPLLALIAPEESEDMAQSLVEEYKQIGYIDRWSQRNRPTAIMSGDPNTIVMVNIWNAGLHNYDVNTAYEAMFKQAQAGNIHGYLGDYELYEEEMNGLTINPDAAVAVALEHELAFAALGNLAKSLHKTGDATYLFGRSLQYREMYNPATGFLQRRDRDGRWDPGFGGYTEGNKWIYLWFVPHDVQGLVDLIGGTDVFDQRLDQFFKNNYYVPDNEPDLQAPFLYNYINRPWKAQRIVAVTADSAFTDKPGGLAGGGNDDLGTMSAWYVLSQIGFYPVDPGIPDFEVCTPRFGQIIIHLKPPYTGKEFIIEAKNAAPQNEYIQSAILNGKPLTKPWFSESEITKGGKWSLVLGSEPNKEWAALPKDRPYSLCTGYNHFPNNPIVHTLVPTSQEQETPQIWRYTTQNPDSNWVQTDFDDQNWSEGQASFGARDWRIHYARTRWDTEDIWMRRTFTLTTLHGQPAVTLCHDEDAEVYINGVLAFTSPGYSDTYAIFPISPESEATLHPGKNVIAIHVRHEDFEAHYADAGLVEIEWTPEEIKANQ